MQTVLNERGYVLVVALLILVVLTLLGIAATNTTIFELNIAGNDKIHKMTLYQAEAGAALSTEVLEQNINCITGFKETSTDVADLEETIRVWSRAPNSTAIYYNPQPWTSDVCTPTTPTSPNISYPIANINSAVELTNAYLGGETRMLAGGSLIMAAGYERKGKSSAGGGTAKVYDIISQHQGLNNSQSTVVFGWRHMVGSESSCKY